MAQVFHIHPQNPQIRLLRQAVQRVAAGGVLVYPTDACYVLGCAMGEKSALERIRQIRRLESRHYFTLACQNLAQISNYARIDNSSYRLIKMLTPGPYTFILPATRRVPKRLLHPKRKTVGIRVPDAKVTQALLAEFGEPLFSTTAQLPDDDWVLSEPDDIVARLGARVDVILLAGAGAITPTTVLDLTVDPPQVVRQGLGEVQNLGLGE